MDKLRIRYSQTGKAAWISHLDMMRMLQRALNRAKIPIRYSEGFNPHALISILLPLSVGTESLCQLADIRVREETDLGELPLLLSKVMPEGFAVEAAYEGGSKPAELKWMRSDGVWEYPGGIPQGTAEILAALFARSSLMVTRRTKRGEGPFDLAPHIRDVRLTPEGRILRVELLCSVNEPVVNPELLVRAVREHCPEFAPDSARFRRLAFLDVEQRPFV